jgi:predicted permease
LLAALLPALDRDVVLADLDDEFRRLIVPHRGRRAAQLWYWRQVLTSLSGAAQLRGRFPWSDLVRDTSLGLRLLARHPAFATTAIATLALGIGVTSAVFTVANAVLLRPLPFHEPDRLVAVMEIDRARESSSGNVSWPDFLDYQSQNQTLSGLAGYSGGSRTLTLPGRPPERVRAVLVTGNFFDVLGVPAARGRTFARHDMPAEAAPVAILSDAAWRTRFGADPDIVGRTIDLNGRPTAVVGVLPATFEFTIRGDAELWLPEQPTRAQVERKFFHWLDIVGRLRAGVTREQAEADLDRIARGFASADPRYHGNSGARVLPLRDRIVGNSRSLVLILTVASALVLLVACANIAGLLLARTAVRGHEMSVRRAMGAGRARIFRQLLAENAALALPGGLLGIAAGQWLMQVLVAAMPAAERLRLPYVSSLGLDWRAIAITAALTLTASLVFGLAPAWFASRREHLAAIRGVAGPDSREVRGQSSLIALQVALAVVLLAGTGLIARSLIRLLDVPAGFDVDRVLADSVTLPVTGQTTDEHLISEHGRIVERLSALPGVVGVSSTDNLPLAGAGYTGTFTVRGDASRRETRTLLRTVARNYFQTMGIPLAAGRTFTQADAASAPPIVIVNERLAATAFGNASAIGQRIAFPFAPAREFEIVGVAGNERYGGVDVDVDPVLYFPYSQSADNQFSLVIRASGDPALLTGPARAAIEELNPAATIVNGRTMTEILAMSRPVFQRRSALTVMGGFAASALLLAAIGLYGVLAQIVARRTREIGVRLALGARGNTIAVAVTRKVAAALGVGLAAGVIGSVFLGRALESLLFGVGAVDPATLGVAAALLGVTAAVACLVPVRRAVRVDPVEALRGD